MRWYESVLIVLVFLLGNEYFSLTHTFPQLIILGVGGVCIIILGLAGFLDKEERRKAYNADRRYIYAIIAFLFYPFFIYLHYVNNLSISGMIESDFTDIIYMFARATGSFLFVSFLGLITLLFKPKKKWETYWFVVMVLSVVLGSYSISSSSF